MKINKELIGNIKIITITIIVGLIIKLFIFQGFVINGYSMMNNYYNGEYIIINKIKYVMNNHKFDRGDVVVINTHLDNHKYFLKRIIGLPGETIIIENGNVFVKDDQGNINIINEGYLNKENNGHTYVNGSKNKKEYLVPKDQYFVMGDNRNHSTDSRACFSYCNGKNSNFIKKEDILGRVSIDLGYFNIKDFSFIHNEKDINTFPKFFKSLNSFNY